MVGVEPALAQRIALYMSRAKNPPSTSRVVCYLIDKALQLEEARYSNIGPELSIPKITR